jgi:uncharacterized membrane protein YgaE (UPF0421/DUF939 family)
MKSFKQIARGNLEFYEYLIKCLVGVTLGYLLWETFPRESGQSYWLLISVLLSITHDNNSKVAHDRMKGNIVGSITGLLAFLLHKPANLVTICIGVALTIILCFRLHLIGVCRTALVGFIIVILYEEQHSSWMGAVYRVASVILGCVLGLAINYVFRKFTAPLFASLHSTQATAAQAVAAEDSSGE